MKETLLITGGSGFLGKALALKLRETYRVVLASRNHARNSDAAGFTGCEAVPLDVSNIESVRDVVRAFAPSVIIHAAASKFVDVSERNPMECIDVNVLGSQNVIRASVDCGVRDLVAVSTDKAAPPHGNIYGVSKAAMERMCGLMDGRGGLRIASVRFGNIAWSTGSVFPIWKRMMAQQGVIESTGPNMRRFFFSVDEASELVLRALQNIEQVHGKILSRHMKSAQISDILDVWTSVRGGTWRAIAARPGDKDDEFLIGPSEPEFTTQVELDGLPHFLIDLANRSSTPLPGTVSSLDVERLDAAEIEKLLQNEPEGIAQ